jgi:hypothetical protein
MDIGLSRIIEMFEERFGRTSATALIGIIAFALATWAVNEIITGFVIPLYHFTDSLLNGTAGSLLTKSHVAALLRGIFPVVPALILSFGWVAMTRWETNRTIRRLERTLGLKSLRDFGPYTDGELEEAIAAGSPPALAPCPLAPCFA